MKQSLRNARGIFLSGAVSAALLLTGCGGGSGSSSTTTDSGTTDTPIGVEQAAALTDTLSCLLGGGLVNLSAADLNILAGTPLQLDTLLQNATALLDVATTTTVQEVLDMTLTLADALSLLSFSSANSDAANIISSLMSGLSSDVLAQTLQLGDLITVPTEILSQTVDTVSTETGVATDALTFLDDTVMGVAGGIGACIPQAQVIVDTLDCVTDSAIGGVALTQADLQTLAVQLPLGDLLSAAQDVLGLGSAATLGDILSAPLAAGDLLSILSGLTSGDPQSVLTQLLDTLNPATLAEVVNLGEILDIPSNLLTLHLDDAALGSLLTTTTGVLGTVEDLLVQVTGDVTDCLQPNLLIGSLGSLLGIGGDGLPLDLSGLLALASTDTTIGDLLAAVETIAGGVGLPIEQLMSTPLTLTQLASVLPLPTNVAALLQQIDAALPLTNQSFTLNDILALPPEVLPFSLDPVNMSINDVLETSVNMLGLLEGMAKGLNAGATANLLNGGVVLPIVTTVDEVGGFESIGGIMTLLPSTLTITPVVSDLLTGGTGDNGGVQELLSAILDSGNPLGAVDAILATLGNLDSGLLSDLVNGLLGGTLGSLLDVNGLLGGLLNTLTGLLGASDAGAITGLLGNLTTDPTALLQTLQGLLSLGSLSL